METKKLWPMVCGLIFSLSYASDSLANAIKLPAEVLRVIPKNIDLGLPAYSAAKAELAELVADCGPGVIAEVRESLPVGSRNAKNRCRYQVKLDSLFFQDMATKTGLLHEADWAYKDGVTWFLPNKIQVPDDFDLRDLMSNGQPTIKKQNCGDCWAWATHHGLEITRAVHDREVYDHAVQTVLSCSKAGSCGGGFMSAVDFLRHGLPEENEFPYAGVDKFCKFSPSAISTGWEGKVIATPYVGDSMRYSLAKRRTDGSFREGTKVQEMIAAIHEWQSPLVVTVSGYSISGGGVYDSCSAINSGGNHMVTIVGWDSAGGSRNAHVWNSWGPSHGENGVSRIQWECGEGRLNRGLGVSAKIVQYKSPCVPPVAHQTYLHEIKLGQSVQIGAAQTGDAVCRWTPTEGLDNPSSCTPIAKPVRTTEYQFSVKNACGTASSMTLVHLWGREGGGPEMVHTAFGDVPYTRP